MKATRTEQRNAFYRFPETPARGFRSAFLDRSAVRPALRTALSLNTATAEVGLGSKVDINPPPWRSTIPRAARTSRASSPLGHLLRRHRRVRITVTVDGQTSTRRSPTHMDARAEYRGVRRHRFESLFRRERNISSRRDASGKEIEKKVLVYFDNTADVLVTQPTVYGTAQAYNQYVDIKESADGFASRRDLTSIRRPERGDEVECGRPGGHTSWSWRATDLASGDYYSSRRRRIMGTPTRISTTRPTSALS